MNYLRAGFDWLNDPVHWTAGGGLLDRLVEHLGLSLGALLLGCAAGWPLGLWLGHRGRGRPLVTSAKFVLPVLAILPLTAPRFGPPFVVLGLALLAVPPLLARAHAGLRRIDPETREAASGLGLSGGQLLRRVELPLALPFLAAGLRTAAVQVVAAATLAAFAGGGGLGEIVAAGIRTGDGGMIVAGGVVVVLLALLVDGLLALLRRAVTPKALRAARRGHSAAAAPAG